MDKELLEISEFDAADYLKTEEHVKVYMEEVISEDNPQAFLEALNTIARSKGMAKIAEETGISRESLYQSLSDKGNPCLKTLWKVLDALGCAIVIRKKAA